MGHGQGNSLTHPMFIINRGGLIRHEAQRGPRNKVGSQGPDKRISGIRTENFPIQSEHTILTWHTFIW